MQHPIPAPGSHGTDTSRIDTSMGVIYTSFGGVYPPGNQIQIRNWTFQDLNGHPYTATEGVLNKPVSACGAVNIIKNNKDDPCKMVWTRSDKDKGNALAPYYVSGGKQHVNIYVS